MSNAPKQLQNAAVSVLKLNSSGPIEALAVVQLDSTGGIVSGGAGGGSTQVSVRDILTGNGDSVMDDTNDAIKVNVVAGSAAGSTITTVSTGSVRVHQSTAADLDANVVQGSTVWPVQVSSVAGLVNIVANNAADGAVQIGDSTNAAIRVNVVAGAAGGSTYVSVRQSTAADLNAAVVQGSTNWAVQVGGPVIARSSAANMLVTAYQSTAADFLATVNQGSTNWPVQVSTVQGVVRIAGNNAADGLVHVGDSTNNALRVNVVAGAAGGSTIVTVSTGSVRVHQSSAADLAASVVQGSTVWQIQCSTVQGRVLVDQNSTVWQAQASLKNSSNEVIDGSTKAPAVGVPGLHVRQVFPTLLSTRVVVTSSNSTALYTLVSSAATPLRHKVYAYSITSTETTPSTLVFYSSNTIDRWAVAFGSGSSGVTGANLAISPPAWLFHSDDNNALRCLIEKAASTQCIVSLSFSYFTEP